MYNCCCSQIVVLLLWNFTKLFKYCLNLFIHVKTCQNFVQICLNLIRNFLKLSKFYEIEQQHIRNRIRVSIESCFKAINENGIDKLKINWQFFSEIFLPLKVLNWKTTRMLQFLEYQIEMAFICCSIAKKGQGQ